MRDPEAMQKDFGALFDSPNGRRVLQDICEYAGMFEAPKGLSRDERDANYGARGLALDICTLAGIQPEIPGSGGAEVPDQPEQALVGRREPDEDDDDEGKADT